MQTYLQSIRNSALEILDRGRFWDGGIFKLIGDNNLLYNAVANKTLDRQLITGDIKSTILSGGSLIAIVFTFLLILALLAVTLISVYCRSRSSKYLIGRKLQSRINRVNQQLPISIRLLFGIICAIVLIMSLVPLVLAFATNSRLHVSISDTHTDRVGTVTNQISQVFAHVDTYLGNLVPEAREDIKPVIQRTLEMTSEMKVKSQSAYQNEFRQVIGANELTDASTDLLNRIGLYYYAGKSLKKASEKISAALNDLRRSKLYSYEEVCLRNLSPSAAHICRNHTVTVEQALQYIEFVRSNWTEPRPVDGRILQAGLNNATNFLGNLVGALDATGNTPDKQLEMKEQKMNLSFEFNRNISSVFDRELNSTEFVLNGVEEKLAELDDKIQSARESLQNASVRVQAAYGSVSLKFESVRFGATTALNVLLLLTLVSLATASAIILLVPNSAKARSRGLICGVYVSYALYAVAFVFVCLLFCLTSYLQTDVCRYMYEKKTADSFLVPEVNAVVAELKARASSDPNKTDAIPLKGVDRLIGGLLDGCQANQPIVEALHAVGYIDTGISNSAEQSLKFKEKGRDILRREMSSANLEVLRDKSMQEKMNGLRTIFVKYSEFDFASVGLQLSDQQAMLDSALQLLLSLNDLNEYIDASLSASEDSAKKLSQNNRENIQVSLDAIRALLNVTGVFAPQMQTFEAQKDVVPVINRVIASNTLMETYLSNQTAWTEAAVAYYTKHVIDGSTSESKAIADKTTVGFLSAIGRCREVYNFYQALVSIPCQSLLYPMSIQWFCLAWFLWFAVLLSLLVHLSLACFVGRCDQQQQQQPFDDSLPLKRPIHVTSNHPTPSTAGDATAQDPLLSSA